MFASRPHIFPERLEDRLVLATSGLVLTEFMAINETTLEDRDGVSSDWIEIQNQSDRDINVRGWYLTDDANQLTKWKFPARVVSPSEYVIVFASDCTNQTTCSADDEFHTNFALGARDFIALVSPDRKIVQSFAIAGEDDYALQRSDVSFGLTSLDNDSLTQALYMETPTPGAANQIGRVGFAANVIPSHSGGVFNDTSDRNAIPRSVTLSSIDADQIIYTLDGTPPEIGNPTTKVYDTPISLTGTTLLRAVALRKSYLPSDVMTRSYISIAETIMQSSEGRSELAQGKAGTVDYDVTLPNHTSAPEEFANSLLSMPTVSLVLNDDDMFGNTGLYNQAGERGIESERSVSIEYLVHDDAGTNFQIDAGIRTHGGLSRLLTKKSLRLYFRTRYGAESLNYPLYGADYPVQEFKQLVLRAGASDSWVHPFSSNSEHHSVYARDQTNRRAQFDMGHASSNHQYVQVFINGLYWGLYDLSERIDSDFAASHFGGTAEDYDVIRERRSVGITNTGPKYEAISGNTDAWQHALSLAKLGLERPEEYEEFAQLVDIDNLIDYMLINLYAVTGDWPHNNWTAVRSRVNGKFRFIVWDSEISLWSSSVHGNNTHFDFKETPTALFAALRLNSEFQTRFADRVQKHFFNEGALTPEASSARFLEISATAVEGLAAEAARWGNAVEGTVAETTNAERIRNLVLDRFIANRTQIMLDQLKDADLFPRLAAPLFTVADVAETDRSLVEMTSNGGLIYYGIGTDPRQSGGELAIGAVAYENAFEVGSPTTIISRARDGDTWSAAVTINITGVVEPANADNFRIAEIHYHPADPTSQELAAGFYDADEFEFMEFINTSTNTIDLSDVRIAPTGTTGTSDGVFFDFASTPFLAPGERIVVVENIEAFRTRYSPHVKIAGQWKGKLSNKSETIRLVGPTQFAQVSYSDDWYPKTDGSGRSLDATSLTIPIEQLSTRDAWTVSTGIHGSPGRAREMPDFDRDGDLTSADIDLLFANIHSNSSDLGFDLNGDQTIDHLDARRLVREIMEVPWGDANLDGRFDTTDLLETFSNGGYGTSQRASWASGDWNGDGVFDSADLVLAFQDPSFQSTRIRN